MKRAGVGVVQLFATRRVNNNELLHRERNASFNVRSATCRKHHDQYVGIADGFEFAEDALHGFAEVALGNGRRRDGDDG